MTKTHNCVLSFAYLSVGVRVNYLFLNATQSKSATTFMSRVENFILLFRSLPYDGDLVFAENFVVDSELSAEVGMTELYSVFNQLHRRLKALQITKEEFVLMKSIALVNAGDLHQYTINYYTVAIYQISSCFD